ncbi:pentapeptide repeat-containing protein [Streptomyces sp. H27-H1]|uniref:pentapeptide repeat-containing protein n=1 Tax=Streptomyces sp. H27-H1 TaxID=2996461 RepID=UPI003B63F5B1
MPGPEPVPGAAGADLARPEGGRLSGRPGGARLVGARLSGARLSGACLRGTGLRGTGLRGTGLREAPKCGCPWRRRLLG